jgi:hypothetical protein
MTKKCRKARKIKRLSNGAVPAHLELLEPRQLLSATWTVNGTPGDDVILVSFDEPTSQISVSLNGTTSMRPAAKVKKLVINGGKGDDTITVDLGSQVLACIINGGAGTDTITCPNSGAVVHGNAGDDVITGGAGNDTLYGDAGSDTINGGAGNDKIFGGAGDDVLIGGAGADRYSDASGHNTLYVVSGVDSAAKGRYNTIINADEPATVVTPPADSGTGTTGSGTTASTGDASGCIILNGKVLNPGGSLGVINTSPPISTSGNIFTIFGPTSSLISRLIRNSGGSNTDGVLHMNGGTLVINGEPFADYDSSALHGVVVEGRGTILMNDTATGNTILIYSSTTSTSTHTDTLNLNGGVLTVNAGTLTANQITVTDNQNATASTTSTLPAGMVITNPGYGYRIVPGVIFLATGSGDGTTANLSGGGYGATGIAEIDANGNLTGITIVNPYTISPSVLAYYTTGTTSGAEIMGSTASGVTPTQSIVDVNAQSGTLVAAPLIAPITTTGSGVICLVNNASDLPSVVVTNPGSGVLVVNGGSQTLLPYPIINGATLQSPTLTSGQLVV